MEQNLFNVHSKLLILSTDLNTQNKYIVSVHPSKIQLPTCEWDITGSNLIHLYNKYVTVDINWANIKLLDTSIVIPKDKKQYLYITYGCVIVLDTKLTDAYWVILNKRESLRLFSNNILDTLKIRHW